MTDKSSTDALHQRLEFKKILDAEKMKFNGAQKETLASENPATLDEIEDSLTNFREQVAAFEETIALFKGDSFIDTKDTKSRHWDIIPDMLTKLGDEMSDLGLLIRGVETKTEEQSKTLSKMNSAIINLDTFTQQIAGMVKETSAATTSIRSDVSQLVTAMAQFKNTQNSGSKAGDVHRAT